VHVCVMSEAPPVVTLVKGHTFIVTFICFVLQSRLEGHGRLILMVQHPKLHEAKILRYTPTDRIQSLMLDISCG